LHKDQQVEHLFNTVAQRCLDHVLHKSREQERDSLLKRATTTPTRGGVDLRPRTDKLGSRCLYTSRVSEFHYNYTCRNG